MQLSENQLLLLRRKKGELNLTTKDLSANLGLSILTTRKAIFGQGEMKRKTVYKINDWLIKQCL